MTKHFTLPFIAMLALVSCNPTEKETTMTDNILLAEWVGPYGGVPAFDQMKVEDVKDAMVEGMKMELEEIEAIANNPDAPTFENTIEELERSGAALNRASSYYGILSSNMSSPEFREIQSELAPLFSEQQSKITQNEKLFKRIKTVYDASLENPLPADQQRVVYLTYISYTMNGAELDAEKKAEYAAINKELSSLYTKFSNNVLHDEENYVTYLTEDRSSRIFWNMVLKSGQSLLSTTYHLNKYFNSITTLARISFKMKGEEFFYGFFWFVFLRFQLVYSLHQH